MTGFFYVVQTGEQKIVSIVQPQACQISDRSGFVHSGKHANLTTVAVALPDDATVVVMQYAVSPQRIYAFESMGITLNVPNDIFSDKVRCYYYDGEYHSMQGMPGMDEYHLPRPGRLRNGKR